MGISKKQKMSWGFLIRIKKNLEAIQALDDWPLIKTLFQEKDEDVRALKSDENSAKND